MLKEEYEQKVADIKWHLEKSEKNEQNLKELNILY